MDSATTATNSYTLTAALLAARREEDGSINLIIADRKDATVTALVTFPANGGPAEQEAMQSFVESIVDPPFEGYALLHGSARLKISGGHAPLRVAAFAPVDEDAPVRSHYPGMRTCVGNGRTGLARLAENARAVAVL